MLEGKNVVVAFSGGVDSSVLLALAVCWCHSVKVVYIDSSLVVPAEREDAMGIARVLGVDVEVIEADPASFAAFQANAKDRCYHCKMANFSMLARIKSELHHDAVIEGSNADDAKDFRPGLKAVAELGILSPLKEAGITKQDVRDIARQLGLPNAERPSNACLASRVAYGVPVDNALLRKIGAAEACVKERLGVSTVRVRVHPGDVARIELLPADLEAVLSSGVVRLPRVVLELKKIGFKKVSLDLEGYKTGSMNDL